MSPVDAVDVAQREVATCYETYVQAALDLDRSIAPGVSRDRFWVQLEAFLTARSAWLAASARSAAVYAAYGAGKEA